MSLVKELRDQIVDPQCAVSTVLRKAKIMAASLQQPALNDWLMSELNGYNSPLPDYRLLRTALLGNFSGPFGSSLSGFSIPVSMLNESFQPMADKLPLGNSVAEIESMLVDDKATSLRHIWPAEFAMVTAPKIRLSNGMRLIELYQPITKPMLAGVLDAVRNRFLDFLLGLQGIDPAVLDSESLLRSLSAKDVSHVFNVSINGGSNVVSAGSTIGHLNFSQHSIAPGDTKSLAAFLREAGVGEEDVQELEIAIQKDKDDTSRTPVTGQQFGKNVGNWFGRTVGKAASGVWKVGAATGSAILQKALMQYYGLD